MQSLLKKIFLTFVCIVILLIFLPDSYILAVTEEECKQKPPGEEKVSCWQDLTNKMVKEEEFYEAEKAKLEKAIAQTEATIIVTVKKIEDLEKEIDALSLKIGNLDFSLDQLSEILIKRIAETYKKGRIDPLALLLSSNNFSEFVGRYKYLRVIQIHDRKLMIQMETVRTNYENQKVLKEEKQKELEETKTYLVLKKRDFDRQKREKEMFLRITRENKERYEELLDEAKRELQALLASKFTEKRYVSRGEVIGLMGNTGFSFGPHLHFGVYDLRESEVEKFDYFSGAQNPFSYLESKAVLFDGTSCDDIPSPQTRTVGTGSWSWPMANPRITQCFGHTPWSFRYTGNFHHGVDMADTSDILVRAVEEGEAYFYRGQTSFGNNVRIFHPNGKMTLYLHLQ